MHVHTYYNIIIIVGYSYYINHCWTNNIIQSFSSNDSKQNILMIIINKYNIVLYYV